MKMKREQGEASVEESFDLPHTTPKPEPEHSEDKASAILAMSPATPNIDIPEVVLNGYQHLIRDPAAIAFLFDSAFSEALRLPSESAAIKYQVTKEQAIEEFRRLLAFKVFA